MGSLDLSTFAPEQVASIELDRDGGRILVAFERGDGSTFRAWLSPLLAAQLARDVGYLSADALAELRSREPGAERDGGPA